MENMAQNDIPEFRGFHKIPRLNRECTVTGKIDGTSAQILITPINKDYLDDKMIGLWYGGDGSTWAMYAGSRSRWVTPGDDNFGFAKWAKDNFECLKGLGSGAHFGEWWGHGIQRKYDLKERRWSLFNVDKWGEARPACCHVVPVIMKGNFEDIDFSVVIDNLALSGSLAAPGYMKPGGYSYLPHGRK